MKHVAVRLLFLSVFLSGCTRQPQTESDAPAWRRVYGNAKASMEIRLNRTTVTFADRLSYEIIWRGPRKWMPSSRKIWQPPDGFIVLGMNTADSDADDDSSPSRRAVWILEPAVPGDYAFDPVLWNLPHGILQSEPIPVRVQSLLPDGFTNSAAPSFLNRPPSLISTWPGFTWKRFLYRLSALFLFLVIMTLLILTLYRYRKTRFYRKALSALCSLDADGTTSAIDFCHALSDLLRSFMDNQFATDLLLKTESECRLALKHASPLSPDLTARLMELLDTCDTIRFAHPPTPSDVRKKMIPQARDVLRNVREETGRKPS